MILVLDTNVIVSAALFPDSVPRKAYEKAFKTGNVITSDSTFEEVQEVMLRKKFDKYTSLEDRMTFLLNFSLRTKSIPINIIITDCSDPKDNKFLELAVSGNADYIISGDDDLLQLNPFRGIPVITPQEFLKLSL